MTATADSDTLRVGVLLDDVVAPAWVERVLARIDASPVAETVLTVAAARERSPDAAPALRAFEWLDAAITTDKPDPLKRVDVSGRCVAPRRTTGGLKDVTLTAIRDAGLDVLLALSTGPPEAPPDLARYGVWWLSFGQWPEYGEGPPAVWEMIDGTSVVGSALLARLPGEDRPRALLRSWSGTDHVSLRRTRSRVLWKTAEFPARRLADLHAGRWSPVQGEPVAPAAERRGKPSSGRLVAHAARLALGVTGRRFQQRLAGEEWMVLYRKRDGGGFRILEPPHGHFYADPFLLERAGCAYLFVEDYTRATRRASIAVAELDGDGRASAPATVLETSQHLSYPFVFEHDGDVFMVPESSSSDAVDLYRATEFPLRWAHERRLIAGVAASDPTLLRHADRWWLFATIAAPGGSAWDELHVFSASSLDGDWTPHPLNPVVTDVRRARPAGRVFIRDGELIRPAQDSSGRYGAAITLCRIDELTLERYRETPVEQLDGSWAEGVNASHTLNFSPSWEVRDAQMTRNAALRLTAGAHPPGTPPSASAALASHSGPP